MKALKKMLDAATARQIMTLDSGERVYFPNGVLGRAYRVPDEESASRVQAAVRWSWLGLLIFIVLYSPVMTVIRANFEPSIAGGFAIGLIALAILPFELASRRARAGLEKVDARYPTGKAEFVIAPLFIALGGYLIYAQTRPEDIFLGLFCVAVFGAMLVISAYNLMLAPKNSPLAH